MACRLKLYIHEHIHVLFWFYSQLCLVPAWILGTKPQLGRRGCKMIASYTGETHPLQSNVPRGLQFNASCSKFYFWQERCQSKGEVREEERSKREKKGETERQKQKGWGEWCSQPLWYIFFSIQEIINWLSWKTVPVKTCVLAWVLDFSTIETDWVAWFITFHVVSKVVGAECSPLRHPL